MNPIFKQIPSSFDFSQNHSSEEISAIANRASEQASSLLSGVSLVGSMLITLNSIESEDLTSSDKIKLADFLCEVGDLARELHSISFDYSFACGKSRSMS